jgi:hypothetical protein
VKSGRWPAEASGTAGVTPTLHGSWAGGVTCALPRIEVHAAIAGVAGPYIALTSNATLNRDGASVEAHVAGGVAAGMLGVGTGVEVTLYTWKP